MTLHAGAPSILDLARRAVAADKSGGDPIQALGFPGDQAFAITQLCRELVRVADLASDAINMLEARSDQSSRRVVASALRERLR